MVKKNVVRGLFQSPIAFYSNKDLAPLLKDYILSIQVNGIDSNVAPSLKHNLKESNFDLFKRNDPIIKETTKFFNTCLTKTLNGLQNEKVEYIINYNESWFHIGKENSSHDCHSHPGCSWCGIYYVQTGDLTTGKTVFLNPAAASFTYKDRGTAYLSNQKAYGIQPEEGLLVLFPSYLSHYQALYKGTEDRIVVAFNMSVL